LREAYQYCKHLTRHHSKSFFFSTLFLPAEKRKAVYALYAFCRTSDDTVDMAEDNPVRALAEWVQKVRMSPPPADSPVLLAWNGTTSPRRL
jgi:phytoene synthase